MHRDALRCTIRDMDHANPRYETARDRRQTAQLAGLAEQFPGWDVREVFGGWEAVPEGTPVVRSSTLDGLAEKLAEQEQR